MVNLDPSSPEQLEIVELFVETILKNHLQWPTWFNQRLILSYDDSAAVTLEAIESNLVLIRDKWLGNSSAAAAFFVDEVSGRYPLLFWSETAPELYHTLAADVFIDSSGDGGSSSNTSAGARGVLVLARNAVSFNHSHGNFEWVDPPPAADSEAAGTLNSNWGNSYYDDFDWRMARQSEYGGVSGPRSNAVAMAAVWPGFDDSKVPVGWNGGNARLILRDVDDGNTLELALNHSILRYESQQAISGGGVDRPWIQVVTFNDWPEGTAVEPDGSDNPFENLYAVQAAAARFKRMAVQEEVEAAVEAEGAMLAHRKLVAAHRWYQNEDAGNQHAAQRAAECLAMSSPGGGGDGGGGSGVGGGGGGDACSKMMACIEIDSTQNSCNSNGRQRGFRFIKHN